MPSTSGLTALIASTVLGHWRSNSTWLLAPRQSAGAPPTPKVQPLNVLKRLSRFMPLTRSVPPTDGAGVAGRGLAATKLGTPPPIAPTGRTRKALPLAALPAQV